MASFDQDLIIFEDDTLLLRYTFTDLEGTFNGTEAVWWAAWSYDDWTDQRTGSANSPGSYTNPTVPDLEKYDNWNGVSPGPSSTGTGDINVVSGDVIVNVYFDQEDFIASAAGGQPEYLDTDVEYYTELVISDTTSENASVVAATGKLFVSSSMFSVAGYRPS